jgi:hypothetical protein
VAILQLPIVGTGPPFRKLTAKKEIASGAKRSGPPVLLKLIAYVSLKLAAE